MGYCCCCSVAKLCLSLCNPMNCSTPVFSVSELAQIHVHPVSDAIQPFHLLSPTSPLTLNLSASGPFPMSQFLATGGQNIGASASSNGLDKNKAVFLISQVEILFLVPPKGKNLFQSQYKLEKVF